MCLFIIRVIRIQNVTGAVSDDGTWPWWITNLYNPLQATNYVEMMNPFYYHYQLNLVIWGKNFFSEDTEIEFQNLSPPTEQMSLIAWQERTYRIQQVL